MHHHIYVHLSSEDSKDIFPWNTRNRFHVKLPKSLNFTGLWEVGLSELQYPHTFSKAPLNIDICSDLCEDSIIDGTCQSVLRRVAVEGEQNHIVTKMFDAIQYFKVRTGTVNEINIYIREDGQENFTLKSGIVRCTLHFRRFIPRLTLP